MFGVKNFLKDFIIFIIEFNVYLFVSIFNFFRQYICPKVKDISEDVVLVTGAGSGIGRLLAIEYARISKTVVGWDVNEKGLQETNRMVEEATGKQMICYKCDCGSPDDVRKIAKRVAEDVGTVTILVNNAGVVVGKSLLDLTDDEIQLTYNVNIMAHFWTTRTFLPAMIKKGRGHIVAMSSITSVMGIPKLTDYCSSKAACTMFMEALEMELQRDNLANKINTTVVMPYLIKTDLFKGCASKYNFIFPALDPLWVAKRTVTATLSNQKTICMSRRMYYVSVMKSMVPLDCVTALNRFSGCFTFMNSLAKHKKE